MTRDFGSEFAAGVGELPVGEWSGPIRSAFGLHLVIVDERMEPRDPEVDAVRRQLVRDWRIARRDEAREEYRAELLAKYRVTIDWPPGLGANAGSSSDGAP